MQPAAVVTGAASGIGRELARCAALEGAAVVLVDCSQDGLADLAAELGKAGAQAHTVLVDLVNKDAGQRLENALTELGLYCDISGQLRRLRRVWGGDAEPTGSFSSS